MIARHFGRRPAIDLRQHTPQHRRAFDLGHGGITLHPRQKPLDLVVLDVEEEIGWRPRGQVAVDGGAQVGVDLPHCRQHRQAQPQRQDHRHRLVARPPDGGQRQPQPRPTLNQPAPCQPPRQPPQPQRRRHQDQKRPRHPRRRPQGQRRHTREHGRPADQRRGQQAQPDQIRPSRPPRTARTAPVQRGGPDAFGPRQRPQREQHRRDDAIVGGLCQRPRIGPHHQGHRQPRLQHRGQRHRNPRTQDQPQRHPQQGQHPDLQDIDPEYHPPPGPQRAQRRDYRHLAVKVRPHR